MGYHGGLRSKRSCDVVQTCASNNTDRVRLTLPKETWRGTVGGVHGTAVGANPKVPSVAMHCTLLQHEFDRLQIRRIDFLSLDVEGFEAQVLRGIDFGRTRIDNILCESHCPEVLRP